MIATDSSKFGYLQFHPKNGISPPKYSLQAGLNTIGSGISSDIRIKESDDNSDSILCIIDVKEDGVALLENKSKHSIELNNIRMNRNRAYILENKDVFVVAGKEFCYVNDTLVPAGNRKSIKVKKRQSVMPSFKVKTVSKMPISTKSVMTRRSLSATKTRKEMSRRSCASALPDRRNEVNQWQTIDTPIFTGRLLQPSTSMKKVSDLSMLVRKSLFLKNKKDTSTKRRSTNSFTSMLSFNDSLSTFFEDSAKLLSPRGLKRNRESSTDSLTRLSKRSKHEDHLVLNVSISRGNSVLTESSSSSTDNTFQDSPLATALYELLSSSSSDISFNDFTNLQEVKSSPTSCKSQKSPLNDLIDVRGVESILHTSTVQGSPHNDLIDKDVKRVLRTPKVQNSPFNDLSDVTGVKKFLRAPKVQKSPLNDLTVYVGGVKNLLSTPKVKNSPVNDLSSIEGVAKFLKTPKVQKSSPNDLTNVEGVKKILKTPKRYQSPLNDLTDVRGVKKNLKTPKTEKSPQNNLTDVRGVKKLLKTPKVQKKPKNDLTEVKGVKKLLRSPKVQKSPVNDLRDVGGVKKLLKTPKIQKSPKNDLTEVKGVKKLLRSPKVQRSPLNDLCDVRGVKKLLKTPKVQKSPKNDLSEIKGVKQLLRSPKVQKSPLNDLGDVRGVKKLLKTPKIQKSPKNDLTEVKGVKKLFKSPKVQKSPLNDLSDVRGVKRLLKTPKIQKEPLNDLNDFEGVKELMNSLKLHDPKRMWKVQKSPLNDLTDVRGVKKILRTPKVQKTPLNDLSDVRGVKELMSTSESQTESFNHFSDIEGIEEDCSKLSNLDDGKELIKSPKYRDSGNIKRTMKVQESPLSDLTDITAVNVFLKSPEVQKSPMNNASNVTGVKKLINRPKIQKEHLSGLNDVEGVNELMGSPGVSELNNEKIAKKVQKSPLNNSRNIKGAVKLLKTAKAQKVPLNDLTDVPEVKKAMRSSKTQRQSLNDFSDFEEAKELLDSTQVNQSLNATLEEVYNELLHSSTVHNSTTTAEKQQSESPKAHHGVGRKIKVVTSVKTSGSNQSLSESVEVSQRGRRIRRKRFDNFEVESPRQRVFVQEVSQKRILRSRKNVASETEEQVSVNSNVDNNTNLKKSEEVEMPPKRNIRGRKKILAEEPDEKLKNDGHVENPQVDVESSEKRGLLDKNDVTHTSVDVDNPNLEIEMAQKRNLRGRKKKIDVKAATPKKRGRGRKEEIIETNTEKNVTGEPAVQRSVRGKQRNESGTNDEKTENTVPPKRSGRGQKKNAEEVVLEEGPMEEILDEPINERRGRSKRKIVIPVNKKTEDEMPQKRSGRGQKKIVQEAAQEESVKEEKKARERKKKAVDTNDDDMREGNKPRANKRRAAKEAVVEPTADKKVEGVDDDDDEHSLDDVKVKKGRKGRAGKHVNENESQQEETVDSTHVQKTYNTRRRGKK